MAVTWLRGQRSRRATDGKREKGEEGKGSETKFLIYAATLWFVDVWQHHDQLQPVRTDTPRIPRQLCIWHFPEQGSTRLDMRRGLTQWYTS